MTMSVHFFLGLLCWVGLGPLGPSCAWGQSRPEEPPASSGRRIAEFTGRTPVTALAFSPDGQCVLCGSNTGVEVRSWPRLEPLRELAVTIDHIYDLAFSPAGDRLLVGGGTPGESGQVQIWTWPQETLLQDLTLHDDAVHAVAWSPEGTRFASASFAGTCLIYDCQTQQAVRPFLGHSQPVLAIGFWDSQRLLSGGMDQTIRLWRAADGTIERTFDNHVNPIDQILVAPDRGDHLNRRMVSISQDRTVRLWQPEIGRMIRFQPLPAVPTFGCWTARGTAIFIGGRDGSLWRLHPETLAIEDHWQTGQGEIGKVVGHPHTSHVIAAGHRHVAAYDWSASDEPR